MFGFYNSIINSLTPHRNVFFFFFFSLMRFGQCPKCSKFKSTKTHIHSNSLPKLDKNSNVDYANEWNDRSNGLTKNIFFFQPFLFRKSTQRCLQCTADHTANCKRQKKGKQILWFECTMYKSYALFAGWLIWTRFLILSSLFTSLPFYVFFFFFVLHFSGFVLRIFSVPYFSVFFFCESPNSSMFLGSYAHAHTHI